VRRWLAARSRSTPTGRGTRATILGPSPRFLVVGHMLLVRRSLPIDSPWRADHRIRSSIRACSGCCRRLMRRLEGDAGFLDGCWCVDLRWGSAGVLIATGACSRCSPSFPAGSGTRMARSFASNVPWWSRAPEELSLSRRQSAPTVGLRRSPCGNAPAVLGEVHYQRIQLASTRVDNL
jgi:hypothetical protein